MLTIGHNLRQGKEERTTDFTQLAMQERYSMEARCKAAAALSGRRCCVVNVLVAMEEE